MHVIAEMGVGGAERVVLALVQAAARRGHEVAVVSAPGPLAENLPLHHPLPLLERRPSRVPAVLAALARARRAFRPDLIHAHNPGVALLVAALTRGGRAPAALATLHGSEDADLRRLAPLLRRCGLPLVAAGPGVEAACARVGLACRTRVDNGVGPPPPSLARGALERAFPGLAGRPTVAFVGRLAPVKRPDLALEAVALTGQVGLLVVGDGPLAPALRTRAESLGIADRVVFCGARPDARALLGACDAALLTSRSEGLPLAVLEAWAAGIPVVAARAPGVCELVRPDEDALLCPPEPAALARALENVLGDSALAAHLARRGRERAADHTEGAMAERYLELYARLLE